ncbi:MAG TPA: hypothetical protein VK912_07825 [Longimicrobiales bacterium]|nr:hypothetical protein [Longimicrobiales bacterium]
MPADRFNEEEAAAIFARAAEAEASGHRPASTTGGMTLAELQEIGREAGLQPEAVAQAAESLRRTDTHTPAPKFLRLPIGVARTVPLERPLTDEEWGELVMQLRSTFNAGGRVDSAGNFREWRNGNLRVTAAPVAGGYQVDMRTSKGSARSLMTTGGIMAVLSGGLVVVGRLAGGIGPDPDSLTTMFTVGSALFGVGVLQIPIWARRRREEFDRIADRLRDAIRS